jgi:hypothetical protein
VAGIFYVYCTVVFCLNKFIILMKKIGRTIGSFKLHKKGEEGIEISSEQLSRPFTTEDGDSDEVFEDKVNTFRKASVPAPILNSIGKLKYYFLNLTGHWISLYDKYIDMTTMELIPLDENASKGQQHLKALWQATTVTQVKYSSGTMQIMGVLDIVDSKPLPINPPAVTPEDELGWYEDAKDRIEAIFQLLVQYFSTAPLKDIEDYRRYLLDRADEATKPSISAFTDEQVMNTVLDGLSRRGYTILADADIVDQEALPETTHNAGSDPVQEAELEMEPEPEPEPELKTASASYTPPVEKVNPFGPPAAEDGQAEPVSEDLQYSEKMGTGDLIEGIDPDPPGEGIDQVPDDDFEV